MAKTQNYSAETRARAVRLVREHAGDYPSEYAAMTAVAQRLGIGSAETLRKWVRQAETDEGKRPGLTTAEAAGGPGAEAEGVGAGADDPDSDGGDPFFRPGGRPATAVICRFIDAFRALFGVVPICRALSGHGVKIAPRTYWARRSRPPSRRALGHGG